ncbi:hypothetical protein OEV98_15050 [Caldibacillus lycopersici]|uniref:Uncharacterized protein n=1 Tax=Perspicuibacillus lycopersici TaxID=1325689 RepID=A0AAE3LNL4_9BACI|nr:hypothetical protein [Perspicuibacillus lycopersici]MCU9614860.1 hypothetical protein [Perspicuibacillus lycopersici]
MYIFLIVLLCLLFIWPITQLFIGLLKIVFGFISGLLGLLGSFFIFAISLGISILLFPIGFIVALLVIIIWLKARR